MLIIKSILINDYCINPKCKLNQCFLSLLICHCGCLDTKWFSREKQLKSKTKQNKLLVITLVIWQYESRMSYCVNIDSRNHRIEMKTTLVPYSVQPELLQKSPWQNPSVLRTHGFCLVNSLEVLVEQNASLGGFYHGYREITSAKSVARDWCEIWISDQPPPADSTDMNARSHLSDTSSKPPMHDGFLLWWVITPHINMQYIHVSMPRPELNSVNKSAKVHVNLLSVANLSCWQLHNGDLIIMLIKAVDKHDIQKTYRWSCW